MTTKVTQEQRIEYDRLAQLLQDVRTAADLRAYAAEVAGSPILDESEQTMVIGGWGPLAPWSTPDGCEVTDDDGEDFTVTLPSGERAQWINRDRDWLDV